MGFFSTTKNKTTTETSTPNVPQWYKDMLDTSMHEAQTLSNRSVDEIVAGFNPDQLQSFDMIRGNVGQGMGDMDTALGSIRNLISSSNTTGSDYQKFMDPYQKNVTDIGIRDLVRNADMQRQKQMSQQQMSGAFGGSRSAIMQAELDKNLNQNVGDLSYKGSSDAFRWANDMALRDRTTNTQNALAQAQGLAGLVGTQRGMMNNDANALNQIGTQQQQLDQIRLDTPQNQTTWFQGLLNQMPKAEAYGSTGTTTTPVTSSGWGSKLLGAGLTAAGVMTGNPMLMSAGMGSMFGGGGGGEGGGSMPQGTNYLSGLMGSSNQTMAPAYDTTSMYNPASGSIDGWLQQGANQARINFANGGLVENHADGGIAGMDWFKKLNAFADKGLNKYDKEGSLLGGLLSGTHRVNEADNRLESIGLAPAKAIAGAMTLPKQGIDALMEQGSGLKDFLTKPYDVQAKEAAVAKALDQAQKAKQAEAQATPQQQPTVPQTPVQEVVKAAVEPIINETVQKQQTQSAAPNQTALDYIKMLQKQIEDTTPKEEKKGMNLPLILAGLKMMGSDKDFFGAVAEGGEVGFNQYAKEKGAKEDKLLERNKASQTLLSEYQKEVLKQQVENDKLQRRDRGLDIQQQNADAYRDSLARRSANPLKAHQDAFKTATLEAARQIKEIQGLPEGMSLKASDIEILRKKIFDKTYSDYLGQSLATDAPPPVESNTSEVEYSTLE